jgi:Ca2+-dependent lipid-binding protein
MEKNEDNLSSLNEFIEVFIEAEKILKDKLLSSLKKIDDYQIQKKEALIKLEEIRKSEVRNEYGIMEGSVLIVSLREARNITVLDPNGDCDPYVVLVCGEKRVQTEYAHSNNPVWREEFSL